MSEIDVTKCRFYLDDGSCCSHDTDCTKCIHCYCDWKVHQEQLYRYKQAIDDIKEIAKNNMDDKQIMAVQTMLNGSPDVKNEVLKQILQKISEVENGSNRRN